MTSPAARASCGLHWAVLGALTIGSGLDLVARLHYLTVDAGPNRAHADSTGGWLLVVTAAAVVAGGIAARPLWRRSAIAAAVTATLTVALAFGGLIASQVVIQDRVCACDGG